MQQSVGLVLRAVSHACEDAHQQGFFASATSRTHRPRRDCLDDRSHRMRSLLSMRGFAQVVAADQIGRRTNVFRTWIGSAARIAGAA